MLTPSSTAKDCFIQPPLASSRILFDSNLTDGEERVQSLFNLKAQKQTLPGEYNIVPAVALEPTSRSVPAATASSDLKENVIAANLQEEIRTIASHKLFDY